ncbi:MAG: ABC transporter ATP-binding protein [Trueperaceae bacterium]|nr:ABC transporter ATP-binding protein [Trueperaceae bacterium]
MTSYRRIWQAYVLPRWPMVVGLLVILLLGTGLQLLNPFLIARFIDLATGGGSLRQLALVATGYLLLATLLQLISILETFLATDLGLKATNALRADLAYHCLNLDLSFHNSRTPGELIERVDGDVAKLSNFFSRFLVDLVGNGLLLLGVLITLFAVNWRVGFALSLFVLLTVGVIHSMRNLGVPLFHASQEAQAKLFGFLEERLSGSEDIRTNGAIPYVLSRFFEHSKRLYRKQIAAHFVGMGIYSTSMILFGVGSALSLGLGAFLYGQGLASLGLVFMIFRYTELLTRPIEVIGRQVQDLQQAGSALLRVQELLCIETKVNDTGAAKLSSGPLSLSFDRVSFRYPDAREDQEATLRELSFKLEPGQTLGLLGRTGSGKTTLSRLLFRFFDVTTGNIFLNGRPLPDYRLSSLNKQIALVTQDVQLFHASLRNNLSLFKKELPDETMLEALKAVGLWDWYQRLESGLDTILEPHSSLSSGQAQLLSFARVFLKNPGLIILDEASSRLDPATEQQLDAVIAKLLQNRTAVIIAHRLKTVQRVDDIMILEEGRCVEIGPREHLEKSDSRFAALLKSGLEDNLV